MNIAKKQILYLTAEIKNGLSFRFYLNNRKILFTGTHAQSPYSNDDNPSLYINKDDRTFHCFSTGKHGDIIKFHRDANKLGFVRTIMELTDILAIQRLQAKKLYPTTKIKRKTNIDRLLMGEAKTYEKFYYLFQEKGFSKEISRRKTYRFILSERHQISTQVYNFIYKVCKEDEFSEKAIEYLAGPKRKLKKHTIKEFRLLEIKNPYYLANCLKKKFPMSWLIRSGVFNEKRNFIFFYHRLLIPYIEKGKIVSLRGRAFPDINGKLKYLNLCGHQAKMIFNKDVLNKIKPKQVLWLCEGEFDTIIATQAGYNAIGFPGVNGIPFDTLKQMNLNQYKLHVAFDADEAGDKAAKELCDNLGITVKRARPTFGNDLSEVYNEN